MEIVQNSLITIFVQTHVWVVKCSALMRLFYYFFFFWSTSDVLRVFLYEFVVHELWHSRYESKSGGVRMYFAFVRSFVGENCDIFSIPKQFMQNWHGVNRVFECFYDCFLSTSLSSASFSYIDQTLQEICCTTSWENCLKENRVLKAMTIVLYHPFIYLLLRDWCLYTYFVWISTNTVLVKLYKYSQRIHLRGFNACLIFLSVIRWKK